MSWFEVFSFSPTDNGDSAALRAQPQRGRALPKRGLARPTAGLGVGTLFHCTSKTRVIANWDNGGDGSGPHLLRPWLLHADEAVPYVQANPRRGCSRGLFFAIH